MIKRLFCLLLFSIFIKSSAAQNLSIEPPSYYLSEEPWTPMITTDSSLFYRVVQSADDLYARIADYSLSFVAQRRRAMATYNTPVLLDGVEVHRRYLTPLFMLRLPRVERAGIQPSAEGGAISEGIFLTALEAGEATPYRKIAVHFTDRSHLAGARFTISKPLARNWALTAAIQARTGRDLHLDGVFTNGATATFHVGKSWDDRLRLGVSVLLPFSIQGLRSSSTAEAFGLTGDPYYNPSWGYQRGKMRNSHVRRECVPLIHSVFQADLSHATSLTASVAIEAGVRYYSALDWFGARTPMPDNYRSMPSYFDDVAVANFVAERWRAEDARYVQIDWDELYAQNRMRAEKEAFYVVSDRVERVTRVGFTAQATTHINDRLLIRYGLRFRYDRSRNYKQLQDLLGGGYLTDIDQYLIDDDTYCNFLQNDLRHPSRRVGEASRFGYDYALTAHEIGAFVATEYHADRFHLEAGLRVSSLSALRRGYYEKELFPGEASFGTSKRVTQTPYVLAVRIGYALTPRHYIGLAVLSKASTQGCENLFLQPQYNNRLIDKPATEKRYAAELNYRFNGRIFRMQLAAFAGFSREGQQTDRYYDDLAALFCDRVITKIGTAAYGVEVAGEVSLAKGWLFWFAATGARYKYLDNPVVALYADAGNAVVDAGSQSYMKKCTAGGAPQLTGTMGITFFGRGWGFRLSANYAGFRYADPDPLRRTVRVAVQAATSPESFLSFMDQERLADAFTMDASVWKSFRIGADRLVASLSVRNLLGEKTAPYNSYESPRIRRLRSGDNIVYQPFSNRYTTIYPRSFYLSLSYSF
ncbi:MAG: TonB-dependent receptor [Alistipes sp.]